jgi:hypothetical protein
MYVFLTTLSKREYPPRGRRGIFLRSIFPFHTLDADFRAVAPEALATNILHEVGAVYSSGAYSLFTLWTRIFGRSRPKPLRRIWPKSPGTAQRTQPSPEVLQKKKKELGSRPSLKLYRGISLGEEVLVMRVGDYFWIDERNWECNRGRWHLQLGVIACIFYTAWGPWPSDSFFLI